MSKFIEVHLSNGMLTINVSSIKFFIKQTDGSVVITFVDDTTVSIKDSYEDLQALVGYQDSESKYNKDGVEFKC